MTNLIRQLWPSWVPDHPRIASIAPVSETRAHTVWKVVTRTGSVFAVKYHLFARFTNGKPYDLLVVEQHVSHCLHKMGCPVPPVITTDPHYGIVIFQWCGDHTLDDCCQTGDVIHPAVFDALLALETGFLNHHEQFAPWIAPGCSHKDLVAGWLETTQPIADMLPDLVAHLTNKTPPAHLASHWNALITHLAEAPAQLGPTDYNARNILIDEAGNPFIIELAKIGYDWPERRLIQYTTSLGAMRLDGRIISLLTPETTNQYAQKAALIYKQNPEVICTHIEAHHMVFHILAALTCLNADHPWQNIPHRLQDILLALQTPLFETPQTVPLRMAFQN